MSSIIGKTSNDSDIVQSIEQTSLGETLPCISKVSQSIENISPSQATSKKKVVHNPESLKSDTLAQFMKKQAIKGMKQVNQMFNEVNIDTGADFLGLQRLEAMKKNPEKFEAAITNILSNAFTEFKAETGREMTYSEMREMYG